MKKLCLLVCVLLLLALPVTARETPELSLHYSYGVTRFDFYKLTDLDLQTGMTAAAPFDGYTDISSRLDQLDQLDTEQLRALSSTVEALIVRDGIAPTYTANTDENGDLTLTDMDMGSYLVIGQQSRDEQYTYTPYPFIVTVPTLVDSQWQFAVRLDASKAEKEEHDGQTTELKVLKLWLDAGTGSKRPAVIDVGLYMDGRLYEIVTLSKENDWSYEWTDLPADHNWTVVEEQVPEGYTMTVEKGAKLFVIRNTGTTPPPPPPNIPQTGQLWWPVPVLAIAGLVLLAVGLIVRRNRYGD